MNRPAEFDRAVVAQLKSLWNFARALTKDRARAEDLVQETVVKALVNWTLFQEGTNLGAWMFTIMRNRHYETARREARMVEDPDGSYAMTLEVPGGQEPRVELQDVMGFVDQLRPDHRKAIIYDMQDTPYEQMAQEWGVPLGTVKSRVSRARRLLAEMVA